MVTPPGAAGLPAARQTGSADDGDSHSVVRHTPEITTAHNLEVIEIASVGHLAEDPAERV